MKTNVTETSRECYHEHVIPNLAASQCVKIANYVQLRDSVTRAMIAHDLDMEKSTVSARVNDLIAAKTLVVLRDSSGEKIKKVCPLSMTASKPDGIRAEWLVHSLNAKPQRELPL